MTNTHFLTVIVASLAGVVASCQNDAPTGARRITPLDVVFETATSPNDTTLLHPYRVYLWGEQVAVLDIQGMRVVSFDRDGRYRWSQGRPGEGPGNTALPARRRLLRMAICSCSIHRTAESLS